MIRATGLTLRRGVKVLLQDTDFVVNPGERLGFVGKNGAGKSTLFALLQGRLDLDSGTLSMPESWRIASVEQEITAHDRPAREFVIDGDTQLRSLQAQREATPDSDGHRIAELESALIESDAWSAPSRAEQLLAGLGFAPHEWMRPVGEFSGGWQMRVALARALMAPSELLLLDEPTNHLDLDAMLWLERWLSAYQGTVLLISHDTEFLDAVARSILHFDQGKLVRYKGGYEDFLTQRAERLRQTRIAWDRQNRETARLQGFIDRFKAKATKAKQAQSRVKALARMEKLAPLHAESGIDIRIPDPDVMPDPLLTLHEVSVGYPGRAATATSATSATATDPAASTPDTPATEVAASGAVGVSDSANTPTNGSILKNVTLMLRAGSRIGVLGVNGAGKSTLIKTLAGELPTMAGELKASKGLNIGYFAQQQLDMLRLDETPLQHLARLAPQTREQELRNYLGGFGFSGDSVSSLVAPMSGGEKARLALSLIVWQKPNLLLLDEPSNHLDVDTREALATALAEFEGSVLLVSHDRHLLRTTVDSFWIVADGGVLEFDGDLEDYREWLNERNSTQKTEARNQAQAIAGSEAPVDRKAQRRHEAEERQRLSKLRKPIETTLKKVETEMENARQRLDELDTLIADPEFYSDSHRDKRPTVLAEHGELTKQMEGLEEQWLELQEELEGLI